MGMVPSGSPASRPEYWMDGCRVELELLYPSAMSPCRSIAIEPIHW